MRGRAAAAVAAGLLLLVGCTPEVRRPDLPPEADPRLRLQWLEREEQRNRHFDGLEPPQLRGRYERDGDGDRRWRGALRFRLPDPWEHRANRQRSQTAMLESDAAHRLARHEARIAAWRRLAGEAWIDARLAFQRQRIAIYTQAGEEAAAHSTLEDRADFAAEVLDAEAAIAELTADRAALAATPLPADLGQPPTGLLDESEAAILDRSLQYAPQLQELLAQSRDADAALRQAEAERGLSVDFLQILYGDGLDQDDADEWGVEIGISMAVGPDPQRDRRRYASQAARLRLALASRHHEAAVQATWQAARAAQEAVDQYRQRRTELLGPLAERLDPAALDIDDRAGHREQQARLALHEQRLGHAARQRLLDLLALLPSEAGGLRVDTPPLFEDIDQEDDGSGTTRRPRPRTKGRH